MLFSSPAMKLPLYGKRILITSPRNYAARLCEQILKKGGLPVLMPTIETSFLANPTALDQALKTIHKFDWIVFTSRTGIAAFFQRMNDLNMPTTLLQNCKLCALGKDAESLLSFVGRVDLVPAEPSPVGIIAEFSQIPQMQQQTVLLPIPEVVGIPEPNIIPNLLNDLKKLGIEFTSVPAYVTQCVDKDIYSVELNLIRQGFIDVIAFSSTAEIESFLRMVNSQSDYEHTLIACFSSLIHPPMLKN